MPTALFTLDVFRNYELDVHSYFAYNQHTYFTNY